MMLAALSIVFGLLAIGAVVISDLPEQGTILLTPREAAEELRVSEKTLWNYSEPRGPIRKIAISKNCVRYDRQQLREDVHKLRGFGGAKS